MSTILEKQGAPASSAAGLSRLALIGARKIVTRRLTDFADDARGTVLLMFSLMIGVLGLMIGLAIDYGRFVNAREQTISAIDSAVLAAGRAIQLGKTTDEAIAIASKYYSDATKNRLAVVNDTVKFAVVDGGTAVQASGNATIKTPFMSFMQANGTKELNLLKDTAAEQSKAIIRVNKNAEYNVEMAVMLDVSGSMCNGTTTPCTSATKLTAMKNAAKSLFTIIFSGNSTSYTSRIALVPFSADVRPPSTLASAMTAAPSSPKSYEIVSGSNSGTYYFAPTDCAAERAGTNKYTDLAPNATNGLMNRVFNQVSKSTTKTAACTIYYSSSLPSTNTIVPMTKNKATLDAAVDALVGQGGTAGHLGTAWTYYMLSPKWSSLLTGESTPVAYNTTATKKIAILMTDGEFNFQYEALKNLSAKKNNVNPTAYSPIAAISNTSFAASGNVSKSINGQTSAYQAMQICANMKANGIEVYTVGFDLGGDATAIDTLKTCATDASKAYIANNAQELNDAFNDIGLKAVPLHLAQ